MSHLRTVAAELLGLFVDDGRFALGILLWVAFVAVAATHLGKQAAALTLAAGLLALLAENLLRTARRQ